MSYSDKQITCSDCGTAFTFSAGEQEFFASKGLPMSPSVARHAVQQESRARWKSIEVPETEITGQPRGKCSR